MATVSFSLITGTTPSPSSVDNVARAFRYRRRSSLSSSVSSNCAATSPTPRKASLQACASRICPIAAAACFSSSRNGRAGRASDDRASAIAPEDTTSTSVPRARSRAMSAATLSSQASRSAPPGSTSSALPIFTTSRRAPASAGTAVTPLKPPAPGAPRSRYPATAAASPAPRPPTPPTSAAPPFRSPGATRLPVRTPPAPTSRPTCSAR